MWNVRTDKLTGARGLHYALEFHLRPASFADVIDGWKGDAEFRSLFNSLLADCPYNAFRWETPAVTVTAASRPFEFVLLDSPGLDRRPEPDAFAEHFIGPETGVVSFANIGKDAILVVPRPLAEPAAYGHLAAFVRLAPEQQRHELWQRVGEALERRLSARPVWLSTAGAGVSWLHVRLDDRPKYYGYEPYRQSAENQVPWDYCHDR